MTNDPGETRTFPSADGPNNALLAGRYQLLEKVGEGGAAEVFRARDTRLDRNVAVKLLRRQYSYEEGSRRRFEIEARAAARLTHPNIVDVYDFGEDDDGAMYLAMRFIEGKSLKDLIARRGRLTPADAISIARQACAALTAAHAQNFIHRDVKPQNIMVDANGNAHLTDFGVVKALSGPALTQSGMTFGTAAYLSPEQATGEVVGPPSDIYALGCVMYEMLSGAPPFTGENPAIVAYKQVWEQPRPLHDVAPEVPPSLENIVMRCLRKEPARRYATAADLSADLDRLAANYNQQTQAVSLGHLAAVNGAPPPGMAVSAAQQSSAIPMPSAQNPTRVAPTANSSGPPQVYVPPRGPGTPPPSRPYPILSASSPPPPPPQQVTVPSRRRAAWLPIAVIGILGLSLLTGAFFLGGVMNGPSTPTPTATVTLPIIIDLPTETPTPQAEATQTAILLTSTPEPLSTETATPEVPIETPTETPPPPAPTDTPEPLPTDTPEPPPPTSAPEPEPTAAPVDPSPTPDFIPFPTFEPVPAPAPEEGTVTLEDNNFTGGFTNANRLYRGVTARWVYGQGTSYASMSAAFNIDGRPRGPGSLTIRGVDSEDALKTPMRIVINDRVIHEGPNPLPNDTNAGINAPGNWGTFTWDIPPNTLRNAQNTITITNLSPSACIQCPSFIMIDRLSLSWRGD